MLEERRKWKEREGNWKEGEMIELEERRNKEIGRTIDGERGRKGK